MEKDKAGDTQIAEETLAGGEHVTNNEDITDSDILDFTGDSIAADQASTLQVGNEYDHRRQEDTACRACSGTEK